MQTDSVATGASDVEALPPALSVLRIEEVSNDPQGVVVRLTLRVADVETQCSPFTIEFSFGAQDREDLR